MSTLNPSLHASTRVNQPRIVGFVLPSAAEWWQSLRWVLVVFTVMIALALSGSFVSYQSVVTNGHPWLPCFHCPGCLFCGMTRSFCAMSSGEWRAAWQWNRGGPALYLLFWIWLAAGFVYFTRVARRSRLRLPVVTLAAIVLASSLLLQACTPEPPPWKDVVRNEPTPSPSPPSVATTNELVVYLDTSASMAGYVTKDGQSILGKTLREVRYTTGTFDSGARVLVRRIASDVGPALTDMELTSASQDQNVYRGGETNLAGAITTFRLPTTPSKPAQPNANTQVALSDPPQAEPIPKFHVLVTDGVQSTKQGGATHDCAAGSDQFCVRQKIGELLQAGWGGCILGLRADFHGKVYSEVSRAAIPYETRTSDSKTFRPFYLYIFSPDRAALDSLVNLLKQRLRPLLPYSEPIRELNLSFPYATNEADFDVVVPKDSKVFISHRKEQGAPPSKLTMYVDVDTERAGAKPFSIVVKLPWSPHALDTANEAELAQFLSWNVERVYPPEGKLAGKRIPQMQIVKTHVDTPGQITIDAIAGYRPGTESPAWCGYRLRARLNLNQSSPSWIKDWSIDLDTTREVGNRTFNLETALLGLWNVSDTKDQTVATAFIRIGPK